MKTDTKQILEDVKNGKLSVDDALLKLKTSPFEDIGYAKIDMHRKIRQGVPEVIYGEGKTPKQLCGIIQTMKSKGQNEILITRLTEENALLFSNDPSFSYFQNAGIGFFGEIRKPSGIGKIVIATGGTSDIPVAEEAAVTAECLRNDVMRLYDVGVSGIHRLLTYKEEIMNASVIIAAAGMEGALPSVIGGLADCPVIALPTSIGYGASFNGLTALLSMLNSCASGVSVVNIDNGFGAGYLASMINHMEAKNENSLP